MSKNTFMQVSDCTTLVCCPTWLAKRSHPSGSCACRTLKPACISEYQAKCLWRSFLQHSSDNGLTVEGTHVGKIAFSATLYRIDRMITSQTDPSASFTFPELLMYVSSLEESLPPLCSPLLEDEERLIAFCRRARQVHSDEWALDFDELDFDDIDSKDADEEQTERGRRLPAGSSIISL
eukprot:TRINITY_DN15727_c0_g1_i2.p2 TRINITY_DN15727_c0_g1~~TRINITY_DN15727_c0_g1_i2.p2  ORF type:complete len:179 (+),score=27.79 TRINITY_DN15727_c0_g1_i2:199-735(+)